MKVMVVGAGEVGFHIAELLSRERHAVTAVHRGHGPGRGEPDRLPAGPRSRGAADHCPHQVPGVHQGGMDPQRRAAGDRDDHQSADGGGRRDHPVGVLHGGFGSGRVCPRPRGVLGLPDPPEQPPGRRFHADPGRDPRTVPDGGDGHQPPGADDHAAGRGRRGTRRYAVLRLQQTRPARGHHAVRLRGAGNQEHLRAGRRQDRQRSRRAACQGAVPRQDRGTRPGGLRGFGRPPGRRPRAERQGHRHRDTEERGAPERRCLHRGHPGRPVEYPLFAAGQAARGPAGDRAGESARVHQPGAGAGSRRLHQSASGHGQRHPEVRLAGGSGQHGSEVIEFSLPADSSILHQPLKALDIPAGCVVGAVVRGDEAIVPFGEDHFEAGCEAPCGPFRQKGPVPFSRNTA